MIDILLNGSGQTLSEGTTLAELIARFGTDPATVAAVNDAFVPRGHHPAHILKPGDRVELLSPMEGG